MSHNPNVSTGIIHHDELPIHAKDVMGPDGHLQTVWVETDQGIAELTRLDVHTFFRGETRPGPIEAVMSDYTPVSAVHPSSLNPSVTVPIIDSIESM
jgi:hypothetical protein